MSPASSKEFPGIQATIECGFTMKRVRDMIKTYNQYRKMQFCMQLHIDIWEIILYL